MRMVLWAVVAQLAEQLLPTPEDPGSNVSTTNLIKDIFTVVNC